MTNVLIAVDDDHINDAITDFVCKHKWAPDTKFRILTVCPWMPPETQVRVSKDLQNFVEATIKSRKALMKKIAEKISASCQSKAQSYEIEETMLQGIAAELILELSESWPADMIILGSHGRKGINLFMMGSVSSAVVNHAACSVIVIRPPQEKAARAALQSATSELD